MSNELIDNILSEKRKPVIKQNGIWLYPYTIENRYTSYVKNLFSVFTSFVISRYMPNIPGWSRSQKEDGIIIDEWSDDIDELNDEYADLQNQVFVENKDQITEELAVFAYLVSTFNKKQQVKIVSRTLNIPTNIINTALIKEPWEDPLLKSWISNNVSLIKGLSDEYIKKINNALITGLQQDLTIADLEQTLRDINKDFSVNRTRLIARDQINKLNGVLTQKRQQDIGADIYQWGTSRDERVRTSHRAMNDKYCTWSDKTVYADTLEDALKGNWKKRSSIGGVEKHPGEDIQCRCYASIVFVDPERVEEVKKKETQKETVKEPTKIKSGKKKIGSEIPKKETQKEKTERLKQELEQKKKETQKSKEELSVVRQRVNEKQKELESLQKKAAQEKKKEQALQRNIEQTKKNIEQIKKTTKEVDKLIKTTEESVEKIEQIEEEIRIKQERLKKIKSETKQINKQLKRGE